MSCEFHVRGKIAIVDVDMNDPGLSRSTSYDEAIHKSTDLPYDRKSAADKTTSDEKKQEPKVGLLQLFRFADKLDALLMVLGLISAAAAGLGWPGMALVFGQITDSFLCFDILSIGIMSNTTSNSTALPCFLANTGFPSCGNGTAVLEDEIATAAIRFAIIGFGVWVGYYLYVSLFIFTAERQTRRMRERFFHAIMTQEISWFDTSNPGELTTCLTEDLNKVYSGIGDKVGSFVQWMSTFVGGILVGFLVEWRLSLVIIGVTPFIAAVASLEAQIVTAFTTKEQKAYGKAGSVAEEVISCIRTVVAFSGENKETRRYQVELDHAKAAGKKKVLSTGLVMGTTYFLVYTVYSLAFWFGGYLVKDQGASSGDIVTTFFAVLIGAFALGLALPNLETMNVARGAAVRVFDIIDRKSEIDPLSDQGEKPDEDTIRGNIEFRNIQFTYPARQDVQVLHDLSLVVGCGETVALVGPSGCGKSTIVQLLQRFYDPVKGAILLDGYDVKDLNVHWLRKHIGIVSQEPILFATTIAENIRYGNEDVTDSQIREAAKQANAHDFIMKLPQNYNTLVGERGAQLSGGQKQRVAIARALVRNPKILLLDEATSALDTESEKVVQSALETASQGRTTIVIAHRLSTIQNATSIASIISGQVVERGTHSELMERKDVYYDLVMAQRVGDGKVESVKSPVTSMSSDIHCSLQLRHRTSSDSFHESRFIQRQASRQKSMGTDSMGDVEKTAEEDEGPPSPAPSVIRVARMNSPEWKYILLGALGAAGAGVAMPVMSVVFAKILRVYGEPCDEMEDSVRLYAPVFIYIGIGSAVSEFSKAFFLGAAGEELTARLRTLVFRAVLRQDMGYFDDPRHSTGVLTTRLATDASEVQGALGARLGAIINLTATLIAALTISLYYDWEMTLVSLAFVPMLVIAGIFEMRALAGHSAKNKKLMEEAGEVAVEAVENIRTVAQLNIEKIFLKKYHDCLEGPYKRALWHGQVHGFYMGLSQAVFLFAQAGAFRFGGWQVEHQRDKYTMEDIFIVFGAIVFSALNLGDAMAHAPDYNKARQAAARVFQLLDLVPSIDSSNKGGLQPDVGGHIGFSDVTFSYPTRPNVKVLNGLSLTIEPGQTVALVGSSGCGKSTCVQLLERLYDPQSGSVLMDSYNIREMNVMYVRSQLGLVSQEPVLFACSIAENIAYGDNSREVSQDEIVSAATKANIHHFVSSLPDGYNTLVGEKGTQLSGGQKQRVAIARALIRNPKILMLDEATSALDTESEKIVQDALDQAREGRTCLVIAHRLSTIHNADKIVVFQNGKVVEEGTHGELMQRRGVYCQLNEAQVHNVV